MLGAGNVLYTLPQTKRTSLTYVKLSAGQYKGNTDNHPERTSPTRRVGITM